MSDLPRYDLGDGSWIEATSEDLPDPIDRYKEWVENGPPPEPVSTTEIVTIEGVAGRVDDLTVVLISTDDGLTGRVYLTEYALQEWTRAGVTLGSRLSVTVGETGIVELFDTEAS